MSMRLLAVAEPLTSRIEKVTRLKELPAAWMSVMMMELLVKEYDGSAVKDMRLREGAWNPLKARPMMLMFW